MTNEEALNQINSTNPFMQGSNKQEEYFDMIRKAIEKQIPKKPQYVDTRFRHHGRKISDGSSLDKCYKCPNCNSHVFHVFDTEKCCQYCGQALDWSDNNV